MGPERGNIEFLADLWRTGRTGVLRRADEVPLEGPPVLVAGGGLIEPWQVVDLAEHISTGPLTIDELPVDGDGDRGAMLRFLLAACGSHLDPYRNLLPAGRLQLACAPDDQAFVSATLRVALKGQPRASELLAAGQATRRQLVALCFLGLVEAEGGLELATDPEAPPRITLPGGESDTEEVRPGAPGVAMDDAFAEAVEEDLTDLSRVPGDEDSGTVEPAVCFVGGVDWGPSADRTHVDTVEAAPSAAPAAAVLVEEIEEAGEFEEAGDVEDREEDTDAFVASAEPAPVEAPTDDADLYEAPEELVWPDEEETGPAPEVEPDLLDDDFASGPYSITKGGSGVEHVLFDDFDALELPDAPVDDGPEYYLAGEDDAEESTFSLPPPADDDRGLSVKIRYRWGPPVDAEVEVIDEDEPDESASTLTWADEVLGVDDEEIAAAAAPTGQSAPVRIGARDWAFPASTAGIAPTDGFDGDRQELLLLQAELDALIAGTAPDAMRGRLDEPDDALDEDDSDAEVLFASPEDLGPLPDALERRGGLDGLDELGDLGDLDLFEPPPDLLAEEPADPPTEEEEQRPRRVFREDETLEHLFSGPADDTAGATLPPWSHAPTFDPTVEPEVLDIYDRLLGRAWECICADQLDEARDVLERATILVADNPRANLLYAWVVLRLEPDAVDVAHGALASTDALQREDPVVDGLVTRLERLVAMGR